jgi:hypothetical protein
VQKRIEEDLMDRLSTEVRTAVFAAVRAFGVPENREVVRTVARASARIAKVVRPFATAGESSSPRATAARPLSKRRARRVAKGPRRVTRPARAAKRRARSRP